MKIQKLSTSGITLAAPTVETSRDGRRFFVFTHGERGRGRWEIRLPLGNKDFPPAHCGKPAVDQEYTLINLKKADPKGNGLFLLAAGRDDGDQLILWSLSPGFRGGASYEVSGKARVIAMGKEAQGDAGRMGGADCPVVHVTGPCRLEWTRTGRLYGEPADWVAEFDGATWHVAPVSECCLEQAVFA
jgi:hypothetical protein